MKIKCSYCGTFYDDTLDKCPSCGAENEGVVRKSTLSQPLTIEELAQWYADRKLPPYETTRFFIGQDYKKPRAFGIYKDEKTGNFVVYKNKDNGQRAVRYEGTDEAYAVNELYQKLKEEIIKQKERNNPNSRNTSTYTPPRRKKKSSFPKKLLIIFVGLWVLMLGGSGIVTLIDKIVDEPAEGYYKYDSQIMYFLSSAHTTDNGYATYDPKTETWSTYTEVKDCPKELKKNKTAKEYFIGKKYKKSFGCTDFLKTDEYVEYAKNTDVAEGYYKVDDDVFYHNALDGDSGWYIFGSDWTPVASDEVPDDIKQYYRAEDFYYTPEWDTETQITDFADTDYYIDSHTSYEDDNDSSSWWDNYDSDSDYDWDSGYDSWDSGGGWDSDW